MLPSISSANSGMACFLRQIARTDRIGIKRCRLVMFILLMLLPQSPALADLMLYPTRIVLEKNQRAAQLELINNGNETATYRISLVNRRMSETGEFSAIDSPLPGEQFADGLLRYSPRQVVLAPGKGQVVRILLRKPADLRPGEYRSHLQFERLPEAKGAAGINAPGNPAAGEIGVTLTALIGASIPIIVRHGETTGGVILSKLTLRQRVAGQPPILAVVLERGGNRSVYGDLTASFTPKGGAEQVVAKAGGVAVYTPNPLRRVKLALKPPPGLVLTHGTLRVTYRQRPEEGGKLLAETAIQVP